MLLIDTFVPAKLQKCSRLRWSFSVFQLCFIWGFFAARLSPLVGEFLFISSGQDIKPDLPFRGKAALAPSRKVSVSW